MQRNENGTMAKGECAAESVKKKEVVKPRSSLTTVKQDSTATSKDRNTYEYIRAQRDAY